MKAGRAPRAPLSSQALDVLAEARKLSRGKRVFPGKAGAIIGRAGVNRAPERAGIAASGHGFRSSFKGWARENDIDELLSEFALAHVEGPKTVAAYARSDLLGLRRPVMQRWADAIS